jgi:hypothetical protein
MTDAHITPTLAALEGAWRRHPELRLGQLLHIAAASVARGMDSRYVADDDLRTALEQLAG